MSNWLVAQRNELKASLRMIRSKQHLIVTQPFFVVDTPITDCDIHFANSEHFENNPEFIADIYFNQGYSPDFSRLRYMRSSGRAALLATWFWDNHHLFADTMQAAMLSDIYFSAHGYCSAYIRNGCSVDGGFMPLCPIFWSSKEVETAASQALLATRSDLLYGGYNSYRDFPQRDVLIEQIKRHIPSNNLFITPHGTPTDQHPFYGMTPIDRMLEWMKYKVTLCISFGGNTAIRIFDMLLGGGIPLVVGRPKDLDAIIPRHMQEALPVYVIDDESPQAIEAAYRICLERFDEGGMDGVMLRHIYTRDNHMPRHRLSAMIDRIRSIAEQADDIDHILGPVG